MEAKSPLAGTTLVIFGITGDLSRRYLLPSLARICQAGRLPDDFQLYGVSRRDISIDDVFSKDQESLKKYSRVITMNLSDRNSYKDLKEKLGGRQVIFYFAVPPDAILSIVRHLGEVGLNGKNARLLLEKPFGVDYASARKLIDHTGEFFKEDQVYSIEHYLAKEMAQNIAVFLGGNVLFRALWNNKHIDRIEIVAEESIDIEGRAGFYEQTGALRDIVQSHLMQLTALVLMKPCPDVFDFSEVPRRRLEALQQILPAGPDQAIRGQYQGYTKDVNNPESVTETFVSLNLESSDPDWRGVPIQLITGKALDKKCTEIRVFFKRTHVKEANKLTLRIQPREGIELDLWVKKPGYEHEIEMLPLDFRYDQHFGDHLPDAYEQVLVDAMRGRQNLFAGSGEILASWKVLDPLIKAWQDSGKGLKIYEKGSSVKQVLAQ